MDASLTRPSKVGSLRRLGNVAADHRNGAEFVRPTRRARHPSSRAVRRTCDVDKGTD